MALKKKSSFWAVGAAFQGGCASSQLDHSSIVFEVKNNMVFETCPTICGCNNAVISRLLVQPLQKTCNFKDVIKAGASTASNKTKIHGSPRTTAQRGRWVGGWAPLHFGLPGGCGSS